MNGELPEIMTRYLEASTRHDVPAAAACFAEDAEVVDEGETYRGTGPIEKWIADTVERYRFRYRSLGPKGPVSGAEVLVAVEVSGSFDGSPLTLDFRFVLAGGKIARLSIR